MKKFLSIFLILVMLVSLAACASPKSEDPEEPIPPVEETDEDGKDEETDSDQATDLDDEAEEEEEQEAEVNLFYTSREYVMTGDENLEKLASEKRKVTYGDIPLEEALVRELLKDPENEELINSIPDSVELIEVKVEDKTAYVNFSKDGMQGGGSLEEILTIDQIVTSLLDLDTIEKVQFLLDGEKNDTLMGHTSITDPFEKE